VTAIAIAAAVLVLDACHGAESPARPTIEPVVDSAALALALIDSGAVALDSVTPLGLRTADGTTGFVHPDVVLFPHRWNGWRFWMAVTPYAREGTSTPDQKENPFVFVSNNGRWWVAPPGLANPVATPGHDAHLSDPDLVFDSAASTLRLYYRETAGSNDRILVTTSRNGVTWSSPRSVVATSDLSLLSPAVARDSTWRMWHVHVDQSGCRATWTTALVRTSPDGLAWGAMRPVALSPPGYRVWHLDVQYLPTVHQFWALVAAYPSAGSCAATDLFLATSGDGFSWTVHRQPLLRRGDVPELGSAVYRSTMAYDPSSDEVTAWVSGNGTGGWLAVAMRWTRTALLQRVDMVP
jgi:hypothetical protein